MKASSERDQRQAAREFRLVHAGFAFFFGALASWLLVAFEGRGLTLVLGVVCAVAGLFNLIDCLNGPPRGAGRR